MSEEKNQNLMIPIAIVVAAAIVGASIYFLAKNEPAPTTTTTTTTTPTAPAATTPIPPVTASDHIMGSINAPVKVVEYDDLECPFCKQFYATMQQIMAAYPGKVAWVIRNFPLQQLHPNAPKLALAAECVAALGGNDDYWKFLAAIVQQAPINTFFDMTNLTPTAVGVGVNATAFNTCVTSGKYEGLITDQFNQAVADGAQGTPFSVIISPNGTQTIIPGSLPYATVQQMINTALTQTN